MKIIQTFCLLLLVVSCQYKASEADTTTAVQKLATRVLGEENAEKITFTLTEASSNNDTFKLKTKDGKLCIEGNSPTALTSGLNWYLKYHTNSHLSWEAKQISIGNELPKLDTTITKTSSVQHSYYLNYCTFNYSMAFWDWERWEKEIDWMALNGVNLPLAIVGIEQVWKNTLLKFNFSDQEIKEFIAGPAFTAWWLMGNLEGWGGPVSDEYLDQQVALQKKILARMKELGMKPVLPGFYGMVPNTLKDKFPNADIRKQGRWAGGFERPAFLSPTDSLFNKMATVYYDELRNIFGDVEYFSGDPFHEGGNAKGIDLPVAGQNIIYGMRNSFPQSTWVFQGWHGNPRNELIRDINEDDLLILDLDCDNRPQWEDRNGWNQKPWIWSAIMNFGGNVGLFGRMDVLAKEPFRALNHESYSKGLKGFGALMEGIENNSVMYELLFELRWHTDSINLDQWLLNYTHRRYGKANDKLYKAWQILRHTVYGKELHKHSSQQGTSESFLCARPSTQINKVSYWGTSQLYYAPSELLPAWSLFVGEAQYFEKSEGFKYDLIDISRQVIANYSQAVHKEMIKAYENGDKTNFNERADEFLQLLDDQDKLLSCNENFMLGKWLAESRERGTSETEKNLFEYNARTQITTWSFRNSNLHEYSHREWSGLLSDFYKPRWVMFINYLRAKLNGENIAEPDYYQFEEAWTMQTNLFPSRPVNEAIETAMKLYTKYFDKISTHYLSPESQLAH